MSALVTPEQALRAFADAHARLAHGLPGGSVWRERRARALEKLVGLGLPSQRDEAWKYTPMRLLEQRPFEPARGEERPDAATRQQIDATTLAVPGARRLTFLDGRFQPALSDEPATIDDLRLGMLADALNAQPDGLLERIPRPSERAEDRFALLNEAFLGEGVGLHVPAGSTPAPVQLQFIAGTPGRARLPRVLIEVESGAHAQIVEQHVSRSNADQTLASEASPAPDSNAMSNAVTNIRLHPGAVLEHYLLIDPSANDLSLHGTYAEQAGASRLVSHRVLLGGRLARSSLQVRLQDRDAAVEVNSLALAAGSEHADAHSVIEHCAPATRSAERFRAAAGKSGRCVFNGRIHVHPGAAGSDSMQSSRGLLLAAGAEIDSRPQLEIYTDDVKCSHGSTTGTLDEDMMFYLLSRGLDVETARAILIFAFLDDVIARMGLDAVRRHLEVRIAAILPHAPDMREFM